MRRFSLRSCRLNISTSFHYQITTELVANIPVNPSSIQSSQSMGVQGRKDSKDQSSCKKDSPFFCLPRSFEEIHQHRTHPRLVYNRSVSVDVLTEVAQDEPQEGVAKIQHA